MWNWYRNLKKAVFKNLTQIPILILNQACATNILLSEMSHTDFVSNKYGIVF
jgi:hypothetical protein